MYKRQEPRRGRSGGGLRVQISERRAGRAGDSPGPGDPRARAKGRRAPGEPGATESAKVTGDFPGQFRRRDSLAAADILSRPQRRKIALAIRFRDRPQRRDPARSQWQWRPFPSDRTLPEVGYRHIEDNYSAEGAANYCCFSPDG